MFGIFKNKQKAVDDDFEKALYRFSEFFSERVEFLDSKQSKDLSESVFAVYQERNPMEAGQSISEFYFDTLVGHVFDKLNQNVIDPHTALIIFKQTNKFLIDYPVFDDKVVQLCMSNWKSLLIQNGVDRMNFDFP